MSKDVIRESDLRTDLHLGVKVKPPFLAQGGRAQDQRPDVTTGANPNWGGIIGHDGMMARRSHVDGRGEGYRLTMGQFMNGSVLNGPRTDRNRVDLSEPNAFIQSDTSGADGPQGFNAGGPTPKRGK